MRGSASVGISYTPRPSDHVSPLRIALFTGNYNHVEDGVSRTLGRLVGYLTGQGHEVLVLGPTIDDPLDQPGTFLAVPSVAWLNAADAG